MATQSIRNGTIRSADIGTGQVKASDIKRGLLRDTTAGNNKRALAVCVQTLTDFVPCLSAEVTMTKEGRIFATADGNADSGSGGVPVGVNTCRLTVDGVAFTDEVVIAANFSPGESFSFAGVTEPVLAGTHSVVLECKGNGTLPGPRIFFPSVTTLELGSG